MGRRLGLNKLAVGGTARVENISASEAMRRRFYDIGLTVGTKIKCVGVSPMGDPAAYLIRGAVIALRMSDSAKITVRTEEAG